MRENPDFDRKCSPALLRQASTIAFNALGDAAASSEQGSDLYSGRLGLALLRVVRCAAGDDDISAHDARRAVVEMGETTFTGGLIGAGASLYAVTATAQILDRPQLLDVAGELVERLDEKRLAADPHLDVMQGTAGAVLALLALERVASLYGLEEMARLALARAAAGSRRLLASRDAREPRAWANPHGVVVTGFAHGAAGIACALLRLVSRLRERGLDGGEVAVDVPRLLRAADAAAEFEEELYDPARDRWRAHAADDGTGGVASAWCYGGPGLALARFEAWAAGERRGGEDEVRLVRALEQAIAAPLGEVDHLCCGNLGRAWALDELSRRLLAADGVPPDSTLGRLARAAAGRADRLAFDALRYFKRRRRFGFDPAFAGSLFKGPAGISLALLAMAERGRVPCLLDLSTATEPWAP